MIYLSRLRLDPMSRRVQNELAKPYEMHRTLCHAFPGLSDEQWRAARVLFRADEDNGQLSLLVQAQRAPDWGALAARLENTRYLSGAPAVKMWEPRFENGQLLRFRLQANPVYAPKRDGAKNGTRQGLYREAERLDWLRRQADQHGFALPLIETTLRRSPGRPITFRGPRDEDELVVPLPVCEIIDLNGGPLTNEAGQPLPHGSATRRARRAPLPLESQSKDNKDKEKPHVVSFGSSEFSAALFDGTLTVTDADKFAAAIENGIGKAKGFGFGLLSVAPLAKSLL